MEIPENKSDSGSLLLTKYVFNSLLNGIITHFKESHQLDSYKDSQLFGFGNYDTSKPNLKNDLELVLRGYVNGKYLYNKEREVASGKPVIKITREYRNILFKYIGFQGIHDFLKEEIKDPIEKDKQLKLLQTLSPGEDYHYVVYYFGEDKKMTKGQLIIHSNWKTFELVFVYFNTRGEHVFHDLFGTIKQENNFVFMDCKIFLDGRKLQGSHMIFYVGLSLQNERPILVGTYSSFDKYDHSISGKLMLLRFDNRDQMERESKSKYFDPIICQELVKQRTIVPSKLPKKLSHVSPKSPYASIFGKLAGDYRIQFLVEGDEHQLQLNIQPYNFNVISNSSEIVIENDRIELESKGQVLVIHFDVVGIFLLQKVSCYIKVYQLLTDHKLSTGQYSGIDINNAIVSGELEVIFLPADEDSNYKPTLKKPSQNKEATNTF